MRDEFVDSNIHVYSMDTSCPEKHKIACQLVSDLFNGKNGATSIQVLCEFYNVSTRKIRKPLSSEEALAVVRNLSFWNLHEPKALDIENAARRAKRFRISFWDAMIIESAIALDCAILWSEDLQDGTEYDGVLVRNPFRNKL